MQPHKGSWAVRVEIQGDEVLEYIGDTESSVEYQVIGFEQQPTRLIDARTGAKRAISEYLMTSNLDAFLAYFNSTAHLELQCLPNQDIQLQLSDSPGKVPDEILWIAIGIQNLIPNYDYLFYNIEPFGDDHFALLSVISSLGAASLVDFSDTFTAGC